MESRLRLGRAGASVRGIQSAASGPPRRSMRALKRARPGPVAPLSFRGCPVRSRSRQSSLAPSTAACRHPARETRWPSRQARKPFMGVSQPISWAGRPHRFMVEVCMSPTSCPTPMATTSRSGVAKSAAARHVHSSAAFVATMTENRSLSSIRMAVDGRDRLPQSSGGFASRFSPSAGATPRPNHPNWLEPCRALPAE